MSYKYSTEIGENCAKAVGLSLPISRKQSVMICNFIRNKNVKQAKQHLAEVIQKKRAVPFTRFNDNRSHRAGMGPGRYPVKACMNILALLESAEANAQFKGLSTADLIIKHASAQKGPGVWRYGRQRRRKAKRSHIELVLEEIKTRAEKKRSGRKETVEAPKTAPEAEKSEVKEVKKK